MARLARDWLVVALLAFIVLLLIIFSRGYLGVVSDGRDYYVQARSMLIDHDLDISQREIEMASARGDARYYAIGAAILWMPFLVVCHLALGIVGSASYVRDGYDAPYMWAVGLASLTYGAAALAMIAHVVADYFSRRLAVLATVVVCAGSFLIWYLAVDASASHVTSLFAVTLFLYLWHRTRTTRGLASGWQSAQRQVSCRWCDGRTACLPWSCCRTSGSSTCGGSGARARPGSSGSR
jgi:hypothetical protein